MKNKNVIGLSIKIGSVILFTSGIILSIALGVLFKKTVTEMLSIRSYFNWGAMFLGFWIDFFLSGLLFSLGEIISLLEKGNKTQRLQEKSKEYIKNELPNI